MNLLQSLIGFLGRALLSMIFIASGVFKLFDWQETLQHLVHEMTDWLALSVGQGLLQSILEWGLVNADSLLIVAVIFELLGGLLVFLGIWVRFGALLLLLFMIPVTLVFHHFWEFEEGPDRMQQMAMFMKNVSITGGLLLLIAYGRGCKSKHQYEQSVKAD